jgi:hypothetical protein
MKKIFAISVIALAVFAACNPEDKTPKGANGKAVITVAQEDLVAYLPMESAQPESGDLTLAGEGAGDATCFAEGRTGKAYFGKAGSFLAYDLAENSPIKSLTALTLSFWVKYAELDYDHAPVPMFFDITNPSDACWGNVAVALDRTATGAGYLVPKFQYQMEEGNCWKTTNWSGEEGSDTADMKEGYNGAFAAGRWNHVIYTADGEAFHCYVNGVDVTPASQVACPGAIVFKNATQIWVGGWPARYYDGYKWGDAWLGDLDEGAIDEIRLYKRALTADEAKALYKAEVNNIN